MRIESKFTNFRAKINQPTHKRNFRYKYIKVFVLLRN